MKSTGIIILAAGSSSRLGQPKQLLQFKGVTLLSHTVVQAELIENSAIVVVTGANNTMIETELKNHDVLAVYNPDWELGMGTSIQAGMQTLLKVYPDIANCIITVCDQPFIEARIFISLIEAQQSTGKGIVASSYVGTLGTPTLFTVPYFDELLNLTGKEGAKKILEQFTNDVAGIPFEKGAIDIDTVEDYNQLISLQ